MSIFTGIILYLMLYWLIIFMVLPWGNVVPERLEVGHAGGAPANPRIKQKFMITAVLAAIAWAMVFTLLHFEVINFYDIAEQMTKEDLQK